MVLGSKRSVPALLLQSWAKRDALLTCEELPDQVIVLLIPKC